MGKDQERGQGKMLKVGWQLHKLQIVILGGDARPGLRPQGDRLALVCAGGRGRRLSESGGEPGGWVGTQISLQPGQGGKLREFPPDSTVFKVKTGLRSSPETGRPSGLRA